MEENISQNSQPLQNFNPDHSQPANLNKPQKTAKVLTYIAYGFVSVFVMAGCVMIGFFFGFSQGIFGKEEAITSCEKQIIASRPTATPTPKLPALLSYADEKNNFIFEYPIKWNLAREDDGPKLSFEETQLKFWVDVDKKYIPAATESAKIKSTKTGTIEVSGKTVETKEYVFDDAKLVLAAQISESPKINVYLSANSQELYLAAKTIIQSLKFQRVSPF